MRNPWLTQIIKRGIAKDINVLLLRKYLGKKCADSKVLSALIEDMRIDVLEFFRHNPEKLKPFVVGGTISYRFNVVKDSGMIEDVQWEPAP